MALTFPLSPFAAYDVELGDGFRCCAFVDRDGRICSPRGELHPSEVKTARSCSHIHER